MSWTRAGLDTWAAFMDGLGTGLLRMEYSVEYGVIGFRSTCTLFWFVCIWGKLAKGVKDHGVGMACLLGVRASTRTKNMLKHVGWEVCDIEVNMSPRGEIHCRGRGVRVSPGLRGTTFR